MSCRTSRQLYGVRQLACLELFEVSLEVGSTSAMACEPCALSDAVVDIRHPHLGRVKRVQPLRVGELTFGNREHDTCHLEFAYANEWGWMRDLWLSRQDSGSKALHCFLRPGATQACDYDRHSDSKYSAGYAVGEPFRRVTAHRQG